MSKEYYKTIDGIDIIPPICNKYRRPIQDHYMKLLKYRSNIFSQKGQDGIINRLIETKFPFTNKWCCEFGAWDGKRLSNTWNLIKNHNWNGIMIESDSTKYKELEKNREEVIDRLIIKNYEVGYLKNNGEKISKPLDEILYECNAPKDIDIISFDTDGPDYYIWEGLNAYRPKIVIIEHNSINANIVYQYGKNPRHDPDGLTSYWAMRELCERKGYIILTDVGDLICANKEYIGEYK